jgi:hypothetical protein
MDNLDSPFYAGTTRVKRGEAGMTHHCRRPNPVFSDEYQLLGDALLEARLGARMTRRGLAERLGKTPSHVARIESGQRRVDTLEF